MAASASAGALRFIRANRRQVGELLLAGFVSNIFVLLLPLFSMILYDRVMGNQVHDTLIALSLGMALALILDLFLRVVRVHFVEHAGARWDMRLDRRLLDGVMSAPADQPIRAGVLLSRYKQVAAAREFLSSGYLLPLADLPFLIVFLGVLASVGGVIVLVPLLAGLFLAASNIFLTRVSVTHTRAVSKEQADKLSTLVEAAEAREILRGQRAGSRLGERFLRLSEATALAGARARFWSGLAQQLMPLVITGAAVAILVVGVFRVEDQLMSVGALTACSLLSSRIVVFFGSVASILARLKEFRDAMRDLDGMLAAEARAATPWGGDAPEAAPKLVVSKLAFAYGDRAPCLEEVDLTVEPGSFVVVVGRAGSGKSTLIRLLSGSLAPDAGSLSLGGRVIESDEDRAWLGRVAATKPQEAGFTRGSFADAVREWAHDTGDEAVLHALRESGFGEALDRALLGLNSEVAAGGHNLSGGQRQMLAMARVFASGRPLLLLDEPTAGLDGTSEQAILAALRARRGKATAIMATHSPDVIALADRVIVMDRGRIAADVLPTAVLGSVPGANARQRAPAPGAQPAQPSKSLAASLSQVA
jgi:ATP-binding cassette subfamily B protein/ATP-binding cassette subfamily C protein LapB